MPNQEQNWKAKYLKAVEKHEAQAVALKNAVKQLRHGIARVSVAGDGVDKSLDKQLSTLRHDIREGEPNEKLYEHVLSISKILRNLNEDKQQRQDVVSSSLLKMLQPLRELDLSRNITDKIKQLEGQLQGELNQKQIPKVVQAYVTLLASILKVLQKRSEKPNTESDSSGSSGGIFGKLLNTKGKSGNEASSVPKDILDKIYDYLNTINTHIPKTEAMQNRAEQVQLLLQQPHEIHSTLEALELITKLIIEAYEQDQQRFQEFVNNINERLFNIQNFLSDSQSDNAATLSDTEELDVAVHNEVKAIAVNIEKANTVDELSASLNQHLAHITHQVDSYKSKEQQRIATREKRIMDLEQQLTKTETEADELRLSLSQQQYAAQTDSLTNLPNRKAYDDFLTHAIARWERFGHELIIAVADVDHFKQVNDNYGHLAGDKVLKKIATILKSSLRSVDFIARFGGEEFVIIMEKTSLENAVTVLEKLRTTIEGCKFHFRGSRVDVTCSFGTTLFNQGESSDSAFARADKLLYEAKSSGRNKVIGR